MNTQEQDLIDQKRTQAELDVDMDFQIRNLDKATLTGDHLAISHAAIKAVNCWNRLHP